MMTVSTIIISYNTKDLTLQTLDSVAAEVFRTDLLKKQSEVIVVDNASSDDSVAAIEQWFQGLPTNHQKLFTLKVIKNAKNVGFGAANNQAVAQAQGEYLFFLNSDTIVQPGTYQKLLTAFSQHPTIDRTAQSSQFNSTTDRLGLIAAELENQGGSLQPQGGDLPSLLALAGQWLFLDDIPLLGQFLPSTQFTGRNVKKALWQKKFGETQKLAFGSAQDSSGQAINAYLLSMGWVAATALMVRQETLAEIGEFDPLIFMYGEDMELCLRAAHHHWDRAILVGAKVTHLGSASSSSKSAIVGEFNAYSYIWSKHFPIWQKPVAQTILWVGVLLRWLIFATMGKTALAKVYWHILSKNYA